MLARLQTERVAQVSFYINGVLMHEPLHLYCNPNDKWVPFVCLANSQVSFPSAGPLVSLHSCARRRPRAGTHVPSQGLPSRQRQRHRGGAAGKAKGTAVLIGAWRGARWWLGYLQHWAPSCSSLAVATCSLASFRAHLGFSLSRCSFLSSCSAWRARRCGSRYCTPVRYGGMWRRSRQ